MPGEVPPLVAELTRKAATVWVAAGGGPALAAWQVWHEGASYVLCGGGEQELPDLARTAVTGGEALVTVRAGGDRAVSFTSSVERIQPDSSGWAALEPMLVKARLNAPDGTAAPLRWAAAATLCRLRPTGAMPEAPGRLPDGSLAQPPRPTPATTPVRKPWVLRRRTR